MAGQMRFIRRNGRVIPIGPKGAGGGSKGPKKRISNQSVDTLKRRKSALKRSANHGKTFAKSAVHGAIGGAVIAGIAQLGRNKVSGKVMLGAAAAVGLYAGLKGRKKGNNNAKKLEYVNRSLKNKTGV